jgi:hypothetical protein
LPIRAKKWQSRKDSTPKVCRSKAEATSHKESLRHDKCREKEKTFETAVEILFPQAVAKAFSE